MLKYAFLPFPSNRLQFSLGPTPCSSSFGVLGFFFFFSHFHCYLHDIEQTLLDAQCLELNTTLPVWSEKPNLEPAIVPSVFTSATLFVILFPHWISPCPSFLSEIFGLENLEAYKNQIIYFLESPYSDLLPHFNWFLYQGLLSFLFRFMAKVETEFLEIIDQWAI